MKLVIGGAYQGKTAYLTEALHIPAKNIQTGETMERRRSESGSPACGRQTEWDMETGRGLAVNGLHLYVKKALREGRSRDEIEKTILSWTERFPEMVLVCDEIGCGVVPIDAFEREYRETVGRICCVLAEKAGQVIRVCCGIGTIIKRQGR